MDWTDHFKRLQEQGIRSVSDLEAFVKVATVAFAGGEPMFRGQANHTWGLVPAVHRPGVSDRYEDGALNYFREWGVGRIEHPPDLRDNTLWLILARHHGIRTRLLDWTRCALIGLFFALEDTDCENTDGRLWAASAARLSVLMKNQPKNVLDTLINGAFVASKPLDALTTVRGYQITSRISAQQGTFTIHGDSTPIESRSCADQAVVSVPIPAVQKPVLRDSLYRLGIRHHCLFPDLDALAGFINARGWVEPPASYVEGLCSTADAVPAGEKASVKALPE